MYIKWYTCVSVVERDADALVSNLFTKYKYWYCTGEILCYSLVLNMLPQV